MIGNYYFPTCTLQDDDTVIGQWEALYERYLQERYPSEYTQLIWSNRLKEVLQSIQEEYARRLEVLILQIAEKEGVTEQLKAADPMEWARRMNNICSRAEEVIRDELING